jgi:AraC-like DNA-binding protein
MHRYPEEEVSYLQPASLPGVQVLVAENSARLWRIYHDTFSICTVFDLRRRLQAEWRYRGRDYRATERSLMMMEPGELHVTRRLTHPGSFRVLLMDPAAVLGIARDEGHTVRDLHLRVPQESADPLYRVFEALTRRIDEGGEPLELQERFHHALGTWLEHCTTAGPRRQRAIAHVALCRAVEYLHAHYADRVKLPDLANAAGISPGHLIHCFSGRLGCSPHRYQLRIRLTHARRMLAERTPISEVAAVLGFFDQASLSRHFKEAWAVTPGQYARSMTNSNA